jgi:hypothetical protein
MRSILAGVMALMTGCGSHPSAEDHERLARLRASHPEYIFQVEGEFYVWATRQDGAHTSPEECKTLYSEFRMSDEGHPRDTSFVYLNCEDERGFQVQVSWDPGKNSLVLSRSPNY